MDPVVNIKAGRQDGYETSEGGTVMNIDKKIIQTFCAPADDVRYFMREPFNHNGKTYATDGCIIVQVEQLDGYTTENREKFLNSMNRLFSDHPPKMLMPIPEWNHDLPDYKDCPVCDGSGKVTAWEDEEEEKPQLIGCDECYDGKIPARNGIDIGNFRVDTRYLRRIESLSNPLIDVGAGSTDPIPFTFDGGIGLVMPMRK